MKILLVIDWQNDFISGSLGTLEAKSITKRVERKIMQVAQQPNTGICFTLDTHNEDYLDTQEGKRLPVKHCIVGTEGHKNPKDILEISRIYSDKVYFLEKESFGMSNSNINELRNFIAWICSKNNSELIEFELIGLCTDICVISNAIILKANFPEIKISVDASCCAGVSVESHKNALECMKICQIDIKNEG